MEDFSLCFQETDQMVDNWVENRKASREERLQMEFLKALKHSNA